MAYMPLAGESNQLVEIARASFYIGAHRHPSRPRAIYIVAISKYINSSMRRAARTLSLSVKAVIFNVLYVSCPNGKRICIAGAHRFVL